MCLPRMMSDDCGLSLFDQKKSMQKGDDEESKAGRVGKIVGIPRQKLGVAKGRKVGWQSSCLAQSGWRISEWAPTDITWQDTASLITLKTSESTLRM